MSTTNESSSSIGFEKKPDNPMFEHVKKQEQEYISGLEQQVLQVALRDPQKYMKYQGIGNSLMNCSYTLEAGIDSEGDKIKARLLLHQIRDYAYDDDELLKEELEMLQRVYGEYWRDEIDNL